MNKKILIEILNNLPAGTHEDTHLYWKGPRIAQYFMWKRLDWLKPMISRYRMQAPLPTRVLDAGGGMGLLLPWLSHNYSQVVMVDLDTSVAREVKTRFGLGNVALLEMDMRKLRGGTFSIIVAAAVLEHFEDLDNVLEGLYEQLDYGGFLIVDLPSENKFYEMGRSLFGITKPDDHYHKATDVRDAILRAGFTLIEESLKPWPINLYYQAVFKK